MKRINRSINIFPIFSAFAGDLLFYIAVDTLFLTLVKGLNASQITAMTMISLSVCILSAMFTLILTKYELIVVEFILLALSIIEIFINKKLYNKLKEINK